ncbi:50S ribosomal protein L2 [Fibrobacterota bacterium]
MPMKTYRPLTPVLRFKQTSDFPEVTSSNPYKPLCSGKKKISGRNNRGVITIRRRGGGHKKLFRLIDFRRARQDLPARVETIEYDPNRSANISLIKYSDGQRKYILASERLKIGQKVLRGERVPLEPGNVMTLALIPVNTPIHNVEIKAGKGGQIARAAGAKSEIVGKDGNYAQVKLPSGEIRMIHLSCSATIGRVGNVDHNKVVSGSAGRSRWLGKRPKVRGVAMNPVDHPMGGGEGRSSGGGHPVSPWGNKAKGKKTRKNKPSNKFIVSRRNKKRGK